MRVYLPATLTELADTEGLGAREARAVTASLRAALGADADVDTAEYAALVLAAADSLHRLGPDDPARRVVAAADLPDAQVPTGQEVGRVSAPAVAWSQVVSFHVDEADDGARALVSAARRGEQPAQAQVEDLDLLWYDVTEREVLTAED